MAEHMAGNDYLPDSKFDQVYSQWGSGGWGALLTGNVQVDPTWLGSASDVAPDLSQLSAVKKTWASWATAMGSQGTPAIMQISHPGRQSGLGAGKKGIWGKNIAPSAIPLDFGPGVVAKVASRTMFGTPKEMTVQQIETVVEQFARTAELAAEAGFAGVELHGAHGYLLDSFLSARVGVFATTLCTGEYLADTLFVSQTSEQTPTVARQLSAQSWSSTSSPRSGGVYQHPLPLH